LDKEFNNRFVKLGKIDEKSILHHYIVVGFCESGEIFGEHGSLNDSPCPFGVEAVSEEVVVFKIFRMEFFKYFGGISADPANELRGNIIIKNNWIN
jgi:CRP-like cAMP-binding protein